MWGVDQQGRVPTCPQQCPSKGASGTTALWAGDQATDGERHTPPQGHTPRAPYDSLPSPPPPPNRKQTSRPTTWAFAVIPRLETHDLFIYFCLNNPCLKEHDASIEFSVISVHLWQLSLSEYLVSQHSQSA